MPVRHRSLCPSPLTLSPLTFMPVRHRSLFTICHRHRSIFTIPLKLCLSNSDMNITFKNGCAMNWRGNKGGIEQRRNEGDGSMMRNLQVFSSKNSSARTSSHQLGAKLTP
jgi:hypothetical protein